MNRTRRKRRTAERAAQALRGLVSCALVVAVLLGLPSRGAAAPLHAPAPAAATVTAPAAGTLDPRRQGDDDKAARYASPRDAMQAFLDNMVAYRSQGHERYLHRAATAFERDQFAQDVIEARAKLLYSALNRVEYVDYDKLPGPADAEISQGRYAVVFGPPPSDSEALLELEFVAHDAGWFLSTATLDAIPRMWERVADLPLIDDLPLLARLQYQLRSKLPAPLTSRVFVLEGWQWLGLFVLAFLAILFDRVARLLTALTVRRIARGERLDDESVAGFTRPMGLWAGAVLFAFTLPALDLDAQILSALDIAAAFVAAVAGVWAAYRLVDVFCDYLTSKAETTNTRFDDVLVPLLRRTMKLFVAVLGAVYLASKWTDDLWGVVAGLGVGSIAIAFAARDTIENLFGTFTVLLDKPFELGDWIIVGDIEGTVEEVGFRSTRIRTFYNSVITVPNRMFVTSEVDNMGRRRYRRIKTMLAVTYDTPPEKVEAFCAGIRKIVALHPYTRKDYYHVYLNGLGASSLDVLLYVFLECPDWGTELREKHRLFADILRLAEQLNVGFAFPTQTLHVAKPEDLEHPDRPASDLDGARHGEDAAARIVAKTLKPFAGSAEKPPPVLTVDDPHARRGSETEAGE